MARNIRVGAHSCVVNPELGDAQPSMGDSYGRKFSRLPSCDGEFAMADLLAFAMGSSP
jgi:hypothetical protein